MKSPLAQSDLQFVIITGTSGSGKSQALKCLEDLGFFCVDNLPPALFQKFTELCARRSGEVRNVALGIDVRERGFFGDLVENLQILKDQGCQVQLLFLEAQDEALVRRFSESRRPHPLLPQRPVIEGIQLERKRLFDLRRQADRIVDTSELTVHDLKAWMNQQYGGLGHKQSMKVVLMTFGYKYGVPCDVDFVFDVRFLKNPYFVPDLNPLTGKDHSVQRYVLETREAQRLLQLFHEWFTFLLPLVERENRSYLTLAIGCTGGRHRSVAIVTQLEPMFEKLGYQVIVRHRDISASEPSKTSLPSV